MSVQTVKYVLVFEAYNMKKLCCHKLITNTWIYIFLLKRLKMGQKSLSLQHLTCRSVPVLYLSRTEFNQPWGSDLETMGHGSKHFPKWVNIWQPKSSEFGDMSIFGHIFRTFVKCFKMKQEVGKFMPLTPYFPPRAKKDVWMEIKQCVNGLASAKRPT